MRALHVYSGNLYGGIERLLATLARRADLCPEMESQFALCFEGRLSAELREAGAAVHLLGAARISRPATLMRARRALREVMKRQRFDAVLCHAPWSQAIFGPAARDAAAVVFVAHDAMDGTHWLERLARRTRPAMAICNSRFTASTVRSVLPGVRTEVVYWPVERSAGAADRGAVRAELETPVESVVIAQACRMESWKGHELLLHSLGMLREVPGWVCWQIGGAQRAHEAGYLARLRDQAEKVGIARRVRFVGERSDVPRLLSAADVHCQPNTSPEPFGIAFVEALAAGLPVVTASLGAAAEIVTPACGILTAPGDARALADALRRLIADPGLRRMLGAAGPARARELCDPRTQMRRLCETIRDAARAREAA
jgi:glycosyltransferase involved in cell wall biosynthesis